MITLALVLAVAAAPAPALSQEQADTMSPPELAARLFPDLDPKQAVRVTTRRAYFDLPESLSVIEVYSKPTDAGEGLCRSVRHARRAQVTRRQPDAPLPGASTPIPLDAPETAVMLLMKPVSGPSIPCADQDPAQFFILGNASMEPEALAVSRLLRAAVADGTQVAINCYNIIKSSQCADPAAELRALPLGEVSLVRRELRDCAAMTADARCIAFWFRGSTSKAGAWFVYVTVKDGQIAGLRLNRTISDHE